MNENVTIGFQPIKIKREAKNLATESIELLDKIINFLYEKDYDSINPVDVLHIYKYCYSYISFLVVNPVRMNDSKINRVKDIANKYIIKKLPNKLSKYFDESFNNEIQEMIDNADMFYNKWLNELYKNTQQADKYWEIAIRSRIKFARDVTKYLIQLDKSLDEMYLIERFADNRYYLSATISDMIQNSN